MLPKIIAGSTSVQVDPAAGGRIAQITIDGTPLLVARGDVDAAGAALAWGAYPMVPWAGRIRDGRFEFRGERYQLPLNLGAHAIHGVGFTSEWQLTDLTPTRLGLRLELPRDESWPFGGSVTQRFEVFVGGLTATMSVTADDRAFPVSFGWHPWFRKPAQLTFAPTAMYRRDDDHIAVDELVGVTDGPWDDCFVNHEPVGLEIDGVHVTISSACDHWVVYDEPPHATCVEPQTGPPDAFNIAVDVVEPGETTTASFRAPCHLSASIDRRIERSQ